MVLVMKHITEITLAAVRNGEPLDGANRSTKNKLMGDDMSRLTAKQKQDRARLRSIKLAEHAAKSRYFSSVYGTGEKVQPHDMNGRLCGISVEAALAVEMAVQIGRASCRERV